MRWNLIPTRHQLTCSQGFLPAVPRPIKGRSSTHPGGREIGSGVTFRQLRCHCRHLANDRIDDAIAEGQRTLQLDPNYFFLDSALAAAYREKGNYPEAIALYTKSQEATHLPSSGLAVTYARMGRRPEAQNILAQLMQAREKLYDSAPLIAAVSSALGDKEGAFRELERAYAEHSGVLQWIAFLPEFRALRSDARFPLGWRIGASQDTILKITETALSETADPNAQSHLTLKVGVRPRPGTPNGHR